MPVAKVSAADGRFQGGVYLIAGGYSIVNELLPLLPKHARKTIIDNQDAFPPGVTSRSDNENIRYIVGDATSALALEQAGIRETDWLICLDRDDRRNEEVCRLARERFRVRDIIVMVQNRESCDQMRFEEVRFVFENRSIAMSIQSILFPGKQIARGVGLEAGELMEVLVLPSSPIVDVPLQIIKPKSWILAAIYREDQVIIPHGETVVKPGDRVLIVGDPQSLPQIAEFIHRGQPGFPLSIGSDVLILDKNHATNELFAEGCYLLDITQSTTGIVLTDNPEGFSCYQHETTQCSKSLDWQSWPENVAAFLEREENLRRFGLVVLSPVTKPGLLRHVFPGLNYWEQTIIRSANVPVLISRGTFPYRKLLVALSPDIDPFFLGTSALELSLMLNAELVAVTVTPPDLVSGRGSHASQVKVLDLFRNLARGFGLYPEVKALIGNPVKELRKLTADSDLAIISHSLHKHWRILDPDVSCLLQLSLPCSTLVIPNNLSHQIIMRRIIGRDNAPSKTKG